MNRENETYDDDYNEGYDDREHPKQGMSTGMKVLIGILVFSGVCLIACCGGMYWIFTDTVKSNPADIIALQESIAEIDIPEEYQPAMGMKWSLGMSMKMAVFAGKGAENGDSGSIMLMEMSGAGLENQQQMKRQFEMQAEQQGQNQQIDVESSEIRTFTIDGKEVEFEFIKGTNPDSGVEMRQVVGTFPGREGVAFLMVFEKEENWDEEQVVQMIESISTK